MCSYVGPLPSVYASSSLRPVSFVIPSLLVSSEKMSILPHPLSVSWFHREQLQLQVQLRLQHCEQTDCIVGES